MNQVINKPEINFSSRLKMAFKSFGFLTWLVISFMLIAGIVIKGHVEGIILIVYAIGHLTLLSFWAFKISKTHIFKVDESEKGIVISYLFKNTPMSMMVSRDQHLFRTVEASKYSCKQIQLLNDDKKILQQHAFGPWEVSEIDAFEKELKRLGFKKPYGENL